MVKTSLSKLTILFLLLIFFEACKTINEIAGENYLLEKNIILRSDFIDEKDVKNYFCASDMITQTYRTATQSGVTQIAYHFERPMLVTDVGGLAEIVPHKKVGYVTSQNPTEIADAIEDFYLNKREKEFEKNTSFEKMRFSWQSLVNAIEELVN